MMDIVTVVNPECSKPSGRGRIAWLCIAAG